MQDHVWENTGREGEHEKVGHRIHRRKVEQWTLLVRGEVEPIAATIEDAANIVYLYPVSRPHPVAVTVIIVTRWMVAPRHPPSMIYMWSS